MSGSFDRVMEDRKQLVNQIIENMKNGYILPKPKWDRGAFIFHNPVSHAQYHGANILRLCMVSVQNGYEDNRWMTFKQAQQMGYKVKKGEKGCRLEKYIFTKQVKQLNENTGEMEKVTVRLERPMVNTFVVFNGEQVEGLPQLESMKPIEPSAIWDLADELINSSECPVCETKGAKAFYSSERDTIVVPPRGIFVSPEAFATTLIHEMVHSTGHESRLNRPILNKFGTPDYAKEELRAELGSFFMGSDLGIEGSEELLASHTQYLESWIQVLQNDPNELFRACSDAQKAVERLSNNLEQFREHTQENTWEQAVEDVLEAAYDDKGLDHRIKESIQDWQDYMEMNPEQNTEQAAKEAVKDVCEAAGVEMEQPKEDKVIDMQQDKTMEQAANEILEEEASWDKNYNLADNYDEQIVIEEDELFEMVQ